jgi:transposase
LNRDESKHRDPHEIICAACGETFVVAKSNRNRKYCCHEHFVAAHNGREILPKPKKKPRIAECVEAIEELAQAPVFEETCPTETNVEEEPIQMFPVRAAREGEKLNPKRVYLLTGQLPFQGKYDYFAGLLPQIAEEALWKGDAFVFCNRQRTQLSVLQWQEDGFALFFKRTEIGRFPWPVTREQKLVEISPVDLRLLLEIPRLIQRMQGIQ